MARVRTRGQLSARVVLLAGIAPVCWLVYALVRGANVQDRDGNDFYPYPFMNVQEHGHPVVLVNCAIVAVLFLAICVAALWIDRRPPGVGPADDRGFPDAGPGDTRMPPPPSDGSLSQ